VRKKKPSIQSNQPKQKYLSKRFKKKYFFLKKINYLFLFLFFAKYELKKKLHWYGI